MRLSIERMVYGGYGISRTPQGVVFVRGALKGEVVEVRVTEIRGDYSLGEVSEVIDPSPFRVSPRCQFFGLCGGCDWQHISYEGQITFKEEALEEVFERIGKEKVKPELIYKGQAWGYRYRVRFHADHRGRLGFFRRGTNEVIWIGSCPVLVSTINEAKLVLDEIGAFEKGTEVSIRSNYGRDKSEVLVSCSKIRKERRKRLKELPFFIVERGFTLKGRSYTYEKWCGLNLKFSYDSFSQVNPKVAEELYLFIVRELKEFEKIWYLYSGVGILGMLLAREGKEVKLIEANESAVKDAQENLKEHSLLGLAEVIRGDAEEVFPSLVSDFDGEALVVDPPRQGIGKGIIQALKGSSIKKVVYVSCHPPVLARDLLRLREAGYDLESLKWVDMFPQTSHIEAIGIFCKKGGG